MGVLITNAVVFGVDWFALGHGSHWQMNTATAGLNELDRQHGSTSCLGCTDVFVEAVVVHCNGEVIDTAASLHVKLSIG